MLGLTGALILTVATAPQVVRLVRSRSAGDFSWGYIALNEWRKEHTLGVERVKKRNRGARLDGRPSPFLPCLE